MSNGWLGIGNMGMRAATWVWRLTSIQSSARSSVGTKLVAGSGGGGVHSGADSDVAQVGEHGRDDLPVLKLRVLGEGARERLLDVCFAEPTLDVLEVAVDVVGV